MPEKSIRYWQSMTTSDVPRAVDRDPVVIVPLAAIEQHGSHLPLSTDLEIGMGLLASAFRQLPDDFPAWVLPPLAVGASEEHMRFPGTLSLAPGDSEWDHLSVWRRPLGVRGQAARPQQQPWWQSPGAEWRRAEASPGASIAGRESRLLRVSAT